MTPFATTIKAQRQASGLTQRELAEKVGIDFTYLSKIENGKSEPPSEATIRKLASVFEYPELELTLLAGKLPQEIVDDFLARPEYQIAYLYNAIKGRELSGPEWFRILDAAQAHGRGEGDGA